MQKSGSDGVMTDIVWVIESEFVCTSLAGGIECTRLDICTRGGR